MQLKQIVLALAAVAAAPAAFALTPAQIDNDTVRLWMSGASATANGVFKGSMTLCQGMSYKDAQGVTHTNPGSIDAHFYLEKSGASAIEPGNGGGDRVAYACTINTDDGRAGSLEGKKVVIYQTYEGGSFNTYAPHLTIAGDTNANLPGNLQRISNVEGLGASGQCAAGTATDVTVNVSGIDNTLGKFTNCARTTVTFTNGQAQRADVYKAPDRPEGGFSDTEYLMNKILLGITTDLSAIGSEVQSNIGQAWGLAVSYPLYYQLQKNDIAASLIAATCDDAPYTAAAPNLTAACQPNLSQGTYTSMVWDSNKGVMSGEYFGGAAGSKLNLARRVPTSGSQSASNIFFLNNPCAQGEAGGSLNPTRAGTYNGGKFVVTENSGTGDVKTKLTNATNASEFGIGVVSAENVPGSSDKWAFVKLNGIAPNADAKQRASSINGQYTFWYETVAFFPSQASTESVDLLNAVNGSLGNPAISDLTGLFVNGLAGASGDNVTKLYRGGNSCSPIQR
jgi:hypothetical protein